MLGNEMTLLRQLHELYWGPSLYVIFALMSLFYIGCIQADPKRRRWIFVIFASYFVIMSPVGMWGLSKLGSSLPERYVRIFWYLPAMLLIPLAIVKLMERVSCVKRWILGGICALVLIFHGGYALDSQYFAEGLDANLYGIPQETMDVADALEAFAADDCTIYAWVDYDLSIYMRAYDAKIQMPYGRHDWSGDADIAKLMADMQHYTGDTFDYAILCADLDIARGIGVNFIVLRADYNIAAFTSRDYYRVATIDGYDIFQYVSDPALQQQYAAQNGIELSAWTITQYASVTGNQAMAYTITDAYGHLIIIDGGWSEDAEWLRGVIASYGDHVDAWILTHPHFDHIEAFNEIYATGDVEIDQIYAISMDEAYAHEIDNWWDQLDVMDRFAKLTSDADNVTYVAAKDHYDIYGLQMDVYHAYDEKQINACDNRDPVNDGGMIFKLSSEHKSILYLADVGISQSEWMVSEWGPGGELHADYVQMGHHGNGGMSEEVYRLIAPSLAFFDAPESLMLDETKNTPIKRALMESMGSEILDYTTAPNVVILD